MKANLKRIIIAAVSQNGIIGQDGKIPWHSKEELNHFKETTLGSPILMGRKTYTSLGKPLPGRLNIIISRNSHEKKGTNLLYFSSVKSAYQYLRNNNYTKVFICGGSSIYRNVIKHAEEMIISHMNFESIGNAKFPRINPKLWKKKKEKLHNDFIVQRYVRINKSN